MRWTVLYKATTFELSSNEIHNIHIKALTSNDLTFTSFYDKLCWKYPKFMPQHPITHMDLDTLRPYSILNSSWRNEVMKTKDLDAETERKNCIQLDVIIQNRKAVNSQYLMSPSKTLRYIQDISCKALQLSFSKRKRNEETAHLWSDRVSIHLLMFRNGFLVETGCDCEVQKTIKNIQESVA